jgi:GNAT superfamily N-acetyltransferase
MSHSKYILSGSEVSFTSSNIIQEYADFNGAMEYHHHNLMAYVVDDDSCNSIKVGEANVLHFYPDILDTVDGDLYEMFDSMQDTFDIYCALNDNPNTEVDEDYTILDALKYYTTLIIDRLEVYPLYRGQKIASDFVLNLVRTNFLKHNQLLVLLNVQAYLIDKKNFNSDSKFEEARYEEEERLIKFYQKLGFIRLNKDLNVMFLANSE